MTVTQAPVVYGKYQLLERLAEGGMAEVFKAKSYGVEGFEKVLVIKRILPELASDPRFVEMFIHEAKLAVTLSHANIVQVFDLGRVEDSYFIAMEYVAGLDLRSLLSIARRADRPLSEGLVVYIASELAKALDYAHRRRDADLAPLNIVHRDVAPENVLVSYEGEVKLTDFGIAKVRHVAQAGTSEPEGREAYLSPEQAKGEDVDARTDIYALGALLYEALAGAPPSGVGPIEERRERIASGEVRVLHEVADVGEELSAIVARATEADPQARYASAGDLYEDLIQYLYASGPRVGAQDLSAYVEELVDLGGGDMTSTPPASSGLEEVFQVTEGSVATGAPRANTPLAVPTSRPPPASRSEGSLPPRAEWRDVCVMAVSSEDPAAVGELVVRYGGQVFPGETIAPDRPALFLFGLGEGAGRDAHEAARCGMRALRAVEHPVKRRILLHQGRVLLESDLSPVRDASLSELRAAALRELREAEWSAVSASRATARSLRARFVLEPATGESHRKITRELRADEGVGRFVGRRTELRMVGEALAFSNQGAARVLGIRGEAGMGKTRLLHETARRLRQTGHEVGLYLTTCVPRSREVPLSGVAGMLRTILGIDDMDADAVVQKKMQRLRELGLSDGQTQAVARTLGLPVEGPASYGTGPLRSALSRIAQKLAEDMLSVFAWDGAEFMDVQSVSVLTRTMASLPRSRVLVVLAYRSGELARSDSLREATVVELGPLSDEEVRKLVRSQLKVPDVPDVLAREVMLKSGGNPMYVEELLSAMHDAGVLTVKGNVVEYDAAAQLPALPRTLRGLMASRVGRLEDGQRSILQAAVVIGARFSVEVLAEVTGQNEASVRAALGVLEERRIVRPLSPVLFTFEHELTREVLYEGLPIDARPGLHAAVARAIESLRSGRELDALASRLAHHYREAGDRERALDYQVRAGERAETEHMPEAAIDAYSDAIELLRTAPAPDTERILELQERIGLLALSTRRAEAIAERLADAVEVAQELGHEAFVARLAMLKGRLLAKASRFQEGRQWLSRAQSVARKLGDTVLERDIALAAAETHSFNGEYNSVIQYAEAALPLARETGDADAQVRALLLVAPAYATRGDGEQALEALKEVRALVGQRPERLTECELSRTRAIVLHQMGDLQGTIQAARHAMELAKEYGFAQEYCIAAHMLGDFYLRSGEDKRAFAALRTSYETATEQALARYVWLNACVLGYLDAMRFEAGQGRMRMQQAIRYAEQRGYTWDQLGEKYLLARVEQRRGEEQAARKALRSVMELAERNGHRRLADDAEQALRALEAGEPIPLPR